jgi:hypothetical protein
MERIAFDRDVQRCRANTEVTLDLDVTEAKRLTLNPRAVTAKVESAATDFQSILQILQDLQDRLFRL